MNVSWAIVLPADQLARAAVLRLRADVEVYVQDQLAWLRGQQSDDQLDALLRQVGGERFVVTADGAIHRPHSRITRGELPAGKWVPIAEWFPLRAPAAALPGRMTARAPLRVVPSDQEVAPGALLADLSEWTTYASSAPALRLAPLRFAVSEEGRALIVGTPLPPIPGERLTVRDGILVPCGYALCPALQAPVLRRALALEDGEIAVFDRRGGWDLVPAAVLQPATRSAVRLSFNAVSL